MRTSIDRRSDIHLALGEGLASADWMFDINTSSAPTPTSFGFTDTSLQESPATVQSTTDQLSKLQLTTDEPFVRSIPCLPTATHVQHPSIATRDETDGVGGEELCPPPRQRVSFSNQLLKNPVACDVPPEDYHDSGALEGVGIHHTQARVDQHMGVTSPDAASRTSHNAPSIVTQNPDGIPCTVRSAGSRTQQSGASLDSINPSADASTRVSNLRWRGLEQGSELSTGHSALFTTDDGITVLRAVHDPEGGLQTATGSRTQPAEGFGAVSNTLTSPCALSRGKVSKGRACETPPERPVRSTNCSERRGGTEPGGPAGSEGEMLESNCRPSEPRIWLGNTLPPAQPSGMNLSGIRSDWLVDTKQVTCPRNLMGSEGCSHHVGARNAEISQRCEEDSTLQVGLLLLSCRGLVRVQAWVLESRVFYWTSSGLRCRASKGLL